MSPPSSAPTGASGLVVTEGAERPIVVGAGISGLAAARSLRRHGDAAILLEASDRPGGTFTSPTAGGYRPEMGPNTVQDSPILRELCADAGIGQDLVEASPLAKRRYLVRDGRLVALPGGPPGLLTTPLLTLLGKLRLATEPFRRAGNDPEEPLAAWVRRRLGAEALPLADAMSLGVYAGDPQELCAGLAFPRLVALEREHGSLFAGLRAARRKPGGGSPRRILGFRGGFGALAEGLAADLDLRRGAAVRSVARDGDEFRVDLDGETLRTGRLVLALPAAETARLVAPLTPSGTPLADLADLPHAPVAVLALGYDRSAIEHPLDGFGFLVPHREGLPILGCLFTSTLFPARAPRGKALLTVMIGGRRQASRVGASDAELVEVAEAALTPLLGLRAGAEQVFVRRWTPGIPQPTPRWAEAIRQADALEAAHPGLRLLGNWRSVGVPDCAAAGWEIASRYS